MKKWQTEKKRQAELARQHRNKFAIPRICDDCGHKLTITSSELHSASKPRCPRCGCTRLLTKREKQIIG
jgi:DNA-directed RNA polymerase subunit RPC12/RpoP